MTSPPEGTASAPGCALLYVRDGFETRGRKRLMGRHSAGESFLKGLATHMSAPELGVAVQAPQEADHLKARFQAWRARPGLDVFLQGDRAGLARHGVYMRPDPHIAVEAWPRLRSAPAGHALCGITHTISSEGALDAIADLVAAPLGGHDALICTSQAVRTAVDAMLERVTAQLVERFAGRVPKLPLRPVIPLGIHADDFMQLPETRSAWRARMGAGDGDFVLLWFGRLSFHAKAHPHALFRAAQAASERLAGPLHIALSGWFSDTHQEKVFRAGAQALCPDVSLHVFDGRDEAVRREAWSAGDAFVLPVDNVQETFGLAPLEAMAAGLVPIVPAWNGFRDTVSDGETGLLVPCAMPPAGAGAGLIAAHESGQLDYDRYLAATAQSVWVDEAAMAEAIVRLAGDPELRRRLAAAAVKRARAEFDWSVIIPRYEALWAEQKSRLAQARQAPPSDAAWANPRRPDPFAMFAHYPDRLAGPHTRVRAPQPLSAARIREAARRPGALSIPGVLLGMRALLDLVEPLAGAKDATLSELVSRAGPGKRDAAIRSLFWLAKHGLVQLDGLRQQDASGQPLHNGRPAR